MDLAKAAVDCIGCNPWEAPPVQSVLDMQPGQAIMRRETVFNKQEGNSCIEYYLQIGLAADVERRAMLDLVDQLLYEPCYNTLRTKQQLGYIVSSGTRLTHGVLGLCITIQSKTHSATSMEARIDEFLTTHLQMLRDMSDDEYGKNVNALIEHKRIKAMSISEQGERLWDSLLHRDGAFDHREADISVIETISKSEVISFYAQEIAPGGDKVRKLIVCVEREPVDAAPDAPDAPDPANPRLLHADDLSRFHEDNKSVRDDAFLRI
jgi:secreted Zn-dependent insulinase-like peptidase